MSAAERCEQASAVTPARQRRSIRRTTTHDCTRPGGLGRPVTIRAIGRDLATTSDRDIHELATGWFEAEAEMTGLLLRLDTTVDGAELLVGTGAHRGFRGRLDVAACDSVGSVGYQLLDDLPIVLMLSGRVPRSAGVALGKPGRRLPVDICAGWIDGGTLLQGLSTQGPPLVDGPRAEPPVRRDDPHSWHSPGPLAPDSTRRYRRIDVAVTGAVAEVESWFRDTHCGHDGIERIVHEYLVRATVDRATMKVTSCLAVAGHLPYPECPNAAASAGRLAGKSFSDARSSVPTDLVGPSTCTHLNDALRALADTDLLLAALDGVKMASCEPLADQNAVEQTDGARWLGADVEDRR